MCHLTAANCMVTAEEFYTDCVCWSSVAAMYVHVPSLTESLLLLHGQVPVNFPSALNTDSARLGKLPVDVLIPLQPHYLTHYCMRGYVVELLLKICA